MPKVIGIERVASYLPEQRLDNLARTTEFGVTQEWLESKLGFFQVARKGVEEDTSDLAAKACAKLLDSGVPSESLECIVVVTQNPDGFGLPHVAAAVHSALRARNDCVCFDLSMGCAGYVYGLSVVKGLMESNGLKRGLLITADPYSKIVDTSDRDTAMIFGDAATATLLGSDPVWEIGDCDFVTDGSERDALLVGEDRQLSMNGRAVFNFCASTVPESVKRACSANGVGLGAVDKFLLHQGSRYIVDTIAERLGAGDRGGFYAANYGNTVSSSVPLLLENNVGPTDRLLALSGFGVGLACASTLLRRVNDEGGECHDQ